MLTAISLKKSLDNPAALQGVIYLSKEGDLEHYAFEEKEKAFLKNMLFSKNKEQLTFTNGTHQLLIFKQKESSSETYKAEYARRAGAKAWGFLKDLDAAVAYGLGENASLAPFLEGCMLASYSFQKYKTEKKTFPSTLEVVANGLSQQEADFLQLSINATFVARTLVNEPAIFLTAPQLSEEIEALGKEYGFETEIFDETRIASLKMAGLLAVNAGSELPPTFSIMCHRPDKPINDKPIVLVGKGVVYDTGGLSLKPTANSMDLMKSDMAGAATVVGTMCAVAKLNLPIEVIGLIPATDNRPGYNAVTPGDVIEYPNGKTVEILNTDAEGRLILADALIFAQKYNPGLVIDVATLTGAAMAAIGKEGAVMMGTASQEWKSQLQQAGEITCERLVEFPIWEEYDKQLKSNIADITNLGGPTGGAITAGKFLQHFIDFEWIHLDIAGPAYSKSSDSYKPAGGSGFGVRLLTRFLSNYTQSTK
ncbi:leucyl aminopeptidase [Litoribacter ruber]|uniref:leucyl aminopeptidase family protein n=1 Tax=Litoribacter ruber TaxID=702568 RepID=UPI001BDA5716|nr:leucyl aminopeptidase [Litoribacter ruber]MBT0811325.1 leucyl aminopeptidase [Litoribacter ruber]